MEPKFQLLYNGQEVETDDLNTVADDAALADDRVFAELFRMTPYDGSTVSKGILHHFKGVDVIAGGVRVSAIRALIGSTVTAASDSAENWKGIRSSVIVGTTTNYQDIIFSNNSSGHPRWDLIYVEVIKDSPETAVTRYVKSATTPFNDTPTSVAVIKNTISSLKTVTGTASATPALPAIPSDSGSTYNIPLTYVMIPDGFTSSTSVPQNHIMDVSPIIPLSKTTAATVAGPATTHYDLESPVFTTYFGAMSWGLGNRPKGMIPPSMCGEDVIYSTLNLEGAADSSQWLIQSGDIVDKRDWRNKFFTWFAMCDLQDFAFDPGTSDTNRLPHVQTTGGLNTASSFMCMGMGQSFIPDSSAFAVPGSPNAGLVALINATNCGSGVAAGAAIWLYVDYDDNGKIKLAVTNFPDTRLFIRITASAYYPNP